MLIIIAATMMALTLTALFLMKGHKTDSAQLNEPRPSIPTMGVQIICGDCSGEGLAPYKTYLTHSGNCEHCGGHSYIWPQPRHIRATDESLADGTVSERIEQRSGYSIRSSRARVTI